MIDADITRDKASEKAKLEALQKKYAGREDVLICDSMPSIEFWFLIHYLNTNKYFATSHDVIQILRRYIPEFNKHESFLSKEKWVKDLLASDRLEMACKRAENYGANSESYSNIYKAFKKFE